MTGKSGLVVNKRVQSWTDFCYKFRLHQRRPLMSLEERTWFIASRHHEFDDRWHRTTAALQFADVYVHSLPKLVALRDTKVDLKHLRMNSIVYCHVTPSYTPKWPCGVSGGEARQLGKNQQSTMKRPPRELFFVHVWSSSNTTEADPECRRLSAIVLSWMLLLASEIEPSECPVGCAAIPASSTCHEGPENPCWYACYELQLNKSGRTVGDLSASGTLDRKEESLSLDRSSALSLLVPSTCSAITVNFPWASM